jgi:hypothetical protein
MRDPAWQDAYQSVQALLRADDTVLAPYGDWPGFPCAVKFYEDLIDIDGASLVLLHKGRLSGARKSQIGGLAQNGQCIFANEVFVVFSAAKRANTAAIGKENKHYRPVDRFIHSASRSNWDSMPPLPSCTMRDRTWREAYQYVYALLRPEDTVLAPRGAWPDFPCAVKFYDDWIDTGGATVVFLYKGRMHGARKSQIAELAQNGQRMFANEVFAVFGVSARAGTAAAPDTMNRHYGPVDQYIRSASLRRRNFKIFYVHVPKTAGTSMWSALSAVFPSNIYYSSSDACLRNPPAGDEYDLIGIHFSPSVIASYISPGDWVVGMVREPTQRLLSAIMHHRRPEEDSATFTRAQRAMREMPIADFLDTDDGRYESLLQLIIFGTDYRKAFQEYSDQQMLDAALAYAKRDNVILAPSDRSEQLAELLAGKFSLPPLSLERLNENNRAAMSDSIVEFEALRSQIEDANACERSFYDFVVDLFNNHLTAAVSVPLNAPDNRLTPSAPASPLDAANSAQSAQRKPAWDRILDLLAFWKR